MYSRSLITSFLFLAVILIPLRLPGQVDTTFLENFNDGDLAVDPVWTRYYESQCPDCITLDDSHYLSAPYSLKISTQDQLSAVESITRIYSVDVPFEFTTHIYVESMGDEAIPCLLRGANTVLALFLLDAGKVQLSVLKDTTVYAAVDLNIQEGYTLGQWHTFTIRYNGQDTTALYIDGLHRGDVVLPLRDTPSIIQLGNRYIGHTSTFYVDDMYITTTLPEPPAEPGTVYLILGSDTGTWDGMNVAQHDNYYRFGLYETGNGVTVIDPAFRAPLRDSFDEPLVFTWWLIGGSMMVPELNPEVDYPWISNLEKIREHLGDELEATGDELALHYHNWIWSDPNGDGTYYWNQSVDLDEYRNDFLETIGRMVLEGDLMPTSFRSGWHYMSNEWSALMDSLIPYRLENDYPNVRTDTEEPLDNTYDWSRAPSEWMPYHPDSQDYQSPGDLKGWETRSAHLNRVDFGLLYNAFMQAYYGTDQVMTLWSHLPEVDFPEQIVRVDSLVKLVAAYFPGVLYDYTTATEGMQKWRGVLDTIPPVMDIATTERGDTVEITISADEPLWQEAPFTYADNGGEHLVRLFPEQVAPLTWLLVFDQSSALYRQIGFAMTDTAGNAAVKNIYFEVVGTESGVVSTLPSSFRLYPAYPNPFNPVCTIPYDLPGHTVVRIIVFNLLGHEVVRLVDGHRPAGRHQVVWNGRDGGGREVPAGMYITRMMTPQINQSIKIVLLK
ncbi:MAG: hypothetical protein JSW54_13830 [Fidelibacterota bacterium]|nr:MAG: hypothetical protein JSW54_13830 [Candidatus Neomarinimicrobiota bacterium]